MVMLESDGYIRRRVGLSRSVRAMAIDFILMPEKEAMNLSCPMHQYFHSERMSSQGLSLGALLPLLVPVAVTR